MVLRFTKMNGAGNDFVLVDNRTGEVALTPQQIVRICDRHRGIGADGILLLEGPNNGADFRMRYYNSDGGEAEMCGNGARCFARFAHKIAGGRDQLSFETPAGVIGAQLDGELVTLQMSDPTDFRKNLTVAGVTNYKAIHFINSGVPHVVVPVERVEAIDVATEGARLRRHEAFAPKGANVNFLEKCGPQSVAIRTFERGVEAETLACGTGVVASALIFSALENAPGPINVLVRGGSELKVGFEPDGGGFRKVTLTGPAEFVFEGTIDL